MEQKKSNRVKIESNSSIYFAMGLVVALSMLFTAFEWQSEMRQPKTYTSNAGVYEVQEIDITRQIEKKQQEIEKPKIVAPDVIDVVEDDIEQQTMFATEDNGDAFAPSDILVPEPPTEIIEEVEDIVYDFVQQQPAFIGGDAALFQYLNETINYPTIAIEQGEQGRVLCSFIVGKDGAISNVHVVRGVSPTLDREAVRVLQSMPSWKPGKQNGISVKVKLTIPVMFRLSK